MPYIIPMNSRHSSTFSRIDIFNSVITMIYKIFGIMQGTRKVSWNVAKNWIQWKNIGWDESFRLRKQFGMVRRLCTVSRIRVGNFWNNFSATSLNIRPRSRKERFQEQQDSKLYRFQIGSKTVANGTNRTIQPNAPHLPARAALMVAVTFFQ